MFSNQARRGAQVSKSSRGQELQFGQTCSHCGAWRGTLGLEPVPELFVEHLVIIFREIRRVLRPDGTVWLNIGDSYATDAKGPRGADKSRLSGGGDWQLRANPPGMQRQYRQSQYRLKKKDLVGIPWRVALALQADGWYLRSDVVWNKPNVTPESVKDRPTKSHEYVFMLTKSPRYFYDAHAVREPQTGNAHSRGSGITPKTVNEKENRYVRANRSFHQATSGSAVVPGGRNKRSVWTIQSQAYRGKHFATFPPALVVPCVLASTSAKGVCPRCGAPWTRILKPAEHANAEHITIGWRPACKCRAGDPVPAKVLDPFCGSGTVGYVCRLFNREFVGVDLSIDYLRDQALARAEGLTTDRALKTLPLFQINESPA